MGQIEKPIPIPDGDSAVFWEACNEKRLLIQQCLDCKEHIFYPRAVCPYCMSNRITWVESVGKGKVYSFTVARRGAGPAFAEDTPYVVALIDLDEGARMMSNIVNCRIENLQCGMQVEVVFEERGEMTLPKFQPV